jgi:hypothetical protein
MQQTMHALRYRNESIFANDQPPIDANTVVGDYIFHAAVNSLKYICARYCPHLEREERMLTL